MIYIKTKYNAVITKSLCIHLNWSGRMIVIKHDCGQTFLEYDSQDEMQHDVDILEAKLYAKPSDDKIIKLDA